MLSPEPTRPGGTGTGLHSHQTARFIQQLPTHSGNPQPDLARANQTVANSGTEAGTENKNIAGAGPAVARKLKIAIAADATDHEAHMPP